MITSEGSMVKGLKGIVRKLKEVKEKRPIPKDGPEKTLIRSCCDKVGDHCAQHDKRNEKKKACTAAFA